MSATTFQDRKFDWVPPVEPTNFLSVSELLDEVTASSPSAYDRKQDKRIAALEAAVASLVHPPVPVPPVPPTPTPVPPVPPTPVPVPVPPAPPIPPAITTWDYTAGAPLDQGPEGECVGYGGGTTLACAPNPITLVDPHTETEASTMEKIYVAAQVIDGTIKSGQAPDEQAGASVASGVQAAQQLGLIKAAHQCTSVTDVVAALENVGPVWLGIDWYDGMMNPDQTGTVHAVGSVVGGHSLCAHRYDSKAKLIGLLNSWGDWGPLHGEVWISVADLTKCFGQNGEAYTVTK